VTENKYFYFTDLLSANLAPPAPFQPGWVVNFFNTETPPVGRESTCWLAVDSQADAEELVEAAEVLSRR
jgi:hypothetical protein